MGVALVDECADIEPGAFGKCVVDLEEQVQVVGHYGVVGDFCPR